MKRFSRKGVTFLQTAGLSVTVLKKLTHRDTYSHKNIENKMVSKLVMDYHTKL